MGSSHSSRQTNDDEESSYESSAFDSDTYSNDDPDDESSLSSNQDESLYEEQEDNIEDEDENDKDKEEEDDEPAMDQDEPVLVEKEHCHDDDDMVVGPAAAIVNVHDLKWNAETLERVITRDNVLLHSKSSPVKYMLQQQFDLEQYTQVAIAILKSSHSIRHLRFKLVPGRLKEHVFWATVFYLLKQEEEEQENVTETEEVVLQENGDHKEEVVAEEEVVVEENSDSEDGLVGSSSKETLKIQVRNDHIPNGSPPQKEQNEKLTTTTSANGITPATNLSSTYGHSFQQVMSGHADSYATDNLHRQLKEKQWKILELENQLEEANARIHELEQGETKTNTSSESKAPTSHKGKWVMNQDSQDFLALDEELKENLRREKSKRLSEVRQQMKFILDSDDLEHTVGEWDCCRAQEYTAKGCCCSGDADSTTPRKVPETHRSASAIL